MEASEHLFRRDCGRMVATLTRVFGIHNLSLAEDVVQEAFCRALEVWQLRGVPENPSAWLMATAKNLAVDAFRRERTARTFAPELNHLLHREEMPGPGFAEMFAPNAIQDDLLRMMFSCCLPQLPEEAQVVLILHILCGSSVGEIASAFEAAIKGSHGRRTFSQDRRACSISERRRKCPADCRQFSARFTCCSMNEGYQGASEDAASTPGFAGKRCA